MRRFRDGPLEDLWGRGEGNFRAAGIFFRYQIPGVNFFLGHSMNIFLGLTGVQEFFSFNFPLLEFFFVLRPPPPPPPPISFLVVRPLKTLSLRMSEHGYTKLNSFFLIFNTAAPSGIFVEYAIVTNWN